MPQETRQLHMMDILDLLKELANKEEFSKRLAETGYDINVTTSADGLFGLTILHAAIIMVFPPEKLRILIDLGIDINAKDSKGQTAVILAIATNQTESIKLLKNIMEQKYNPFSGLIEIDSDEEEWLLKSTRPCESVACNSCDSRC